MKVLDGVWCRRPKFRSGCVLLREGGRPGLEPLHPPLRDAGCWEGDVSRQLIGSQDSAQCVWNECSRFG